MLLFVDQLEELFTHLTDPADGVRNEFAQRLWKLATAPAGQVSVLCTMRTDFRAHCGDVELEGFASSEGAGDPTETLEDTNGASLAIDDAPSFKNFTSDGVKTMKGMGDLFKGSFPHYLCF